MGHENRIEQLEGLHNIETNGDFYERLAAGKIATSSSAASSLQNGTVTAQPYYIPVPITIKAQLGSPVSRRRDAEHYILDQLCTETSCRPLWPLVPLPQL